MVQWSGLVVVRRLSWFEMKYMSSPRAGRRACLNLVSLRLLEIVSIRPWRIYLELEIQEWV